MAAVFRRSLLGNKFSLVSCLQQSPKHVRKVQVAGMKSVALREKDYKRPTPFPYQDEEYGLIASLFDTTTWRFDENSKLIVVDGPFASGKSKLAKELAKEFDLHYIPPAHLDHHYVNSYGYDFRMMNEKLPPHMRSFDVEDFLANPKDRRRSTMEYIFFGIRLNQYLDALNHILNTGQGVIMSRSIFSTPVVAEAYIKHGFLPPGFKNYTINQIWEAMKPDLMRPHLIIYLDTPVDVVRKNLEKKGNPLFLSSPVMQPSVLQDIEDNYKFKYLQELSKHSELLIYDNTEVVEAEIVMEDIERVKLDGYGVNDEKMSDWRHVSEGHWTQHRIMYSRDRFQEFEVWLHNIPAFDCDEMMFEAEDARLFYEIWKTAPGNKYQPGFNPDLGDNVAFKWKGAFFP